MTPDVIVSTWLNEVGIKHGKDLLDDLKGEPLKVTVAALTDVAKLRVKELAGQDVTVELAFAESTLKDLAVAVQIKTVRSILQVIADSANMAGSILLGILGKI